MLGKDNAETLSSMVMAGLARAVGGKYDDSETIHRETLARRVRVLGHEHPDTLTSVYCLAQILTSQRHCKEALALYEKACSGY